MQNKDLGCKAWSRGLHHKVLVDLFMVQTGFPHHKLAVIPGPLAAVLPGWAGSSGPVALGQQQNPKNGRHCGDQHYRPQGGRPESPIPRFASVPQVVPTARNRPGMDPPLWVTVDPSLQPEHEPRRTDSRHGESWGLGRTIRPRASRLLDAVEIRLLRLSDGHSGDRSRWIAETKAAAADGTLDKRIESQRNLGEIVEQWTRTATI